ncbi:MAG: hypothetical protein DCF20_05230 [Pseudanabaena sp.]|nr:MAG: hypothetical protein DCF20_05230 [Pseudanabaena sp.]
MATLSFDTTQPAQVIGLGGYTVDPIFTVGDKIGTYVPPGILDGIGAFSLNDTTVRIYVNHELGSTVGYNYTLQNSTKLAGARISYFDVDKRTFQIVDSGLAYDTIYNRAGNVVSSATAYSATNVNGIDTASGFNRFCSAALFEANQFGDCNGLADRIFFTGEESGGNVYALDTATNALYALPWFGRAGYENVTEVDTGTTDQVAFIIGDDRSPSTGVPLLLYVGNKVADSTNFLERNGLAGGKLYVWVADDPNHPSDPIEKNPTQFNGNNASLNGKFVEIDQYDLSKAGTTGYDDLGFVTQAKQDSLAFAEGAFGFARIEDVGTNPQDGTQIAFNATGNSSLFGGQDSWGTTYRIDIDFNNIATGDIVGKIDILYDGNVTKDSGLRSPDNLTWSDDGKIYIQEDPAVTGFGQTSGLTNSIFSIDPSNDNPSSTLTRLAIADRSAAGLPATQTDSDPKNIGSWETSGIIDVSKLFGAKPGELFLFDVQAHSLVNGSIITATNIDGNGDGIPTAAENLVEGGQLAFLIAPRSSVVGTKRADKFEAGVTEGFDGFNDSVSTGDGNDRVDSSNGFGGNNLIDTGKGNDTIILANGGDRVFAGLGKDQVNAVNARNYYIDGGAGNDTFFLGVSGTVLGGDGNDSFFATTGDDIFFDPNGAGNLLYGGAGADKFWLFNGEAPSSPITIVDFEVGKDVIGFIGLGKGTFSQLTLSGDTISFDGETIATLTGIETSKLTANSFKFVKDF